MNKIPSYRIGNDITVLWAIHHRDNYPYDLSGKEVKLYVSNSRGKEEVPCEITTLPDGSINNVIRWDFLGSQQKVFGLHTLTVSIISSDNKREIMRDYVDAFNLVSSSALEDTDEGDANIAISGDLILSSKLDIYRIEGTNADLSSLRYSIYEIGLEVSDHSSSIDLLGSQLVELSTQVEINATGISTKVEQDVFNIKTGELNDKYTQVETTVDGVVTEIKGVTGEVTEIRQSVDGIVVSVGDLQADVESLTKQGIGEIETWFYPGVPSSTTQPEVDWTTDEIRSTHIGDLYYDENTGYAYRYMCKDNVYYWGVIKDSDIIAALEAARNNNRTFISEPTPPYKQGDIWIAQKDYDEQNIKQDNILVCVTSRESGNFVISDWEIKGSAINYADLQSFIDDYYRETILPEIKNQTDGVARTYYQDTDPRLEWEDGSYDEHVGDLWFNATLNQSYYWSGTEWVESEVPEEIFDKIDGKSTIYTSIPSAAAYKANDLWFTEKDYNVTIDEEHSFIHNQGEVLVALNDAIYDEETDTYLFSYLDWAKKDSYTDDTAVQELDNYVNTTFKDGVLDESEKKSIKGAWDSIALAQAQLTDDYLTVILAGSSLAEFVTLQEAYKNVYNEEATDENPLGTYQILEAAVNEILAYDVTIDAEYESTLENLLTSYDEAYDNYRLALSEYSTAYAAFTNAMRAQLGEANKYLEAITDDGKLTPIEKKQLLQVYKGLVAEYGNNIDAALNAKIWKLDDEGTEVPGAYPGPEGVGTEYFDTYVEYREVFIPILNVFTGTDWGFDRLDETTVFAGELNLTLLNTYFDNYYSCLEDLAHVLSLISAEKDAAVEAIKEYTNSLEEHLTPSESITQVSKGVVLSSIIGVGTYDSATDTYLLKAALNSTSKVGEDLTTYHEEYGRIVIAGGIDNQTDWNDAATKLYENGHFVTNSADIIGNIHIGGDVLIDGYVAFTSLGLTSTDTVDLSDYGQVYEAFSKLVDMFDLVIDENGTYINTKYDFVSQKGISSLGYSSTSGGGGGSSYSRLDAWSDYTVDKAGYVLSAGLGYGLYTQQNTNTNNIAGLLNRVTSLEGKATAVSFSQTQTSGTQIGTITIDGVATTLYVGRTLGTAASASTTSSITSGSTGLPVAAAVYEALQGKANKATTLSGYGITNAYTKTEVDNKVSSIGSSIASLSTTKADKTQLADYLPLAGGTIGSGLSNNFPLGVSSTSGYTGIAFITSEATAWFRYQGGSTWGVTDNGWNNSYTLIHSGNIGSQSVSYATSAGSATKLANSRTIWGQSFNGTGNVSGSLILGYNTIRGASEENALELSADALNLAYSYRAKTTTIYGGSIRFARDGAYSMFINSSGNVTIGASDLAGTSAKLYVDGIVKIRAAEGKEVVFEQYAGGYTGACGLSFFSNSAFIQGSITASTLLLNPKLGGNVGIGTTSPAYKLDVKGTGRFTGAVTMSSTLSVGGNIDVGYNKLTFATSASDYHIGWGNNNMFVYANYYGHYFTSRGTTRMTIASDGAISMSSTLSVGGNTTLDSNLTVEGSTVLNSTLGVSGLITASSGIKIASGQSIIFMDSSGNSHTLSYDSTKGAFKFDGNVYSTAGMTAMQTS